MNRLNDKKTEKTASYSIRQRRDKRNVEWTANDLMLKPTNLDSERQWRAQVFEKKITLEPYKESRLLTTILHNAG